MNPWITVFLALLGTGGLGSLGFSLKWRHELRRMTVDTEHAVVQTAIAVESADDEHWKALIETQTTALIAPLRDEVARLVRRVEELDSQVSKIRRRYNLALDVIRAYVRYTALLASLLAGAGVAAPPPPPIPTEIDDDF